MKKLALGLIAISSAVLGFGMVAEAQYGSVGGTATVTPTTTAPGGTVTVEMSGCTPGETVDFVLESATASATCAEDGTASASLPAPGATGTYTGTAAGVTSGVTASFSVVVAQAVTPPGGLPATGSDGISTTAGIAIGLLVIGVALFGVSQIRRRQTITAA
jgi:hypothetical protein